MDLIANPAESVESVKYSVLTVAIAQLSNLYNSRRKKTKRYRWGLLPWSSPGLSPVFHGCGYLDCIVLKW